MKSKFIKYACELLWDAWCIVSIVGIWPRFIEPNLISVTKLDISLNNRSDALNGLKILQISDLHFSKKLPSSFLRKILKNISTLSPDLILFTGDFICYSKLDDSCRLKNFLSQLHAPYGTFAILGNHDYSKYVSINEDGDYDLIKDKSSGLIKGFARLLQHINVTGKFANDIDKTPQHEHLNHLLERSGIRLLHNETWQIFINNCTLNLTGLGEYMFGQCDSALAFKNYDINAPGIVLLHNPDGLKLIESYPGDLVLCGHTHGSQINLPWIKTKCTLLENMTFTKGLFKIKDKLMYVNRGIGCVVRFRWFSRPELTQFTIRGNR